jgi:hypothetical protein
VMKQMFSVEITYQVLFVANYSHVVEPDWLIYKGDNASALGCDWSKQSFSFDLISGKMILAVALLGPNEKF